LLALGISGGLLPCPSALVVLLAAISLHRVAYGLLLVSAFSVGLAGVLTAVGLAFVYAGRLFKPVGAISKLTRVLPAVSAFVITCAGAVICWEAVLQAGVHPDRWFTAINFDRFRTALGSAAGLGILCLGLLYGLKHKKRSNPGEPLNP